jgi:hypothetical protein
MGFFTSKSESKHLNPVLAQYTENYRSWAPWSFETTDPEAFLQSYAQAERLGKKGQFGTTGAYEGYTPEAKARAEEQAAGEKADKKAADEALERIRGRAGEVGEYLTADDQKLITEQVDKAFAYQYGEAERQFKRAADYMAGGRGLRMSDTPVAQEMGQALKETHLGLGAQRGQAFLGAGLEIAGQRMEGRRQAQAFDMGFVEFQRNLEQNRWATRLNYMYGGGMQGASQIQHSTTQFNTKSGFDQMMSIATAPADMAKSYGQAISSFRK